MTIGGESVKGNLLVIDDEPVVLDELELRLEEYADKVFSCTSAEDGLEIIKSQEIHCIVCDIKLPGMNGIDLFLHTKKAGITVPFIFYTGRTDQQLMVEAIKHGAFDFVHKPNLFGMEDVIQRGLAHGTGREYEEQPNAYESEYRKLLKQILAKRTA